jgi:hypothetical protein
MSKHADGEIVELEPGIFGDIFDLFLVITIIKTNFEDAEPPFEPRDIKIHQDKWVSDIFDLLEPLGKLVEIYNHTIGYCGIYNTLSSHFKLKRKVWRSKTM